MNAGQLAVEGAARAETFRDGSVDRRAKVSRPLGRGGLVRKSGMLKLPVGLDVLAVFGTRLNETRRYVQGFRRELRARDHYRPLLAQHRALGKRGQEFEWIVAWHYFKIDTRQRIPYIAIG